MKQWKQRLGSFTYKIKKEKKKCKNCQASPEARKILPESLQREYGLVDTLNINF